MRRATAAMVSFARLADGPGAVRGPRTWAGLPRVSKEMQPSCGQMGPFRPWSARRCWALGRPNAAPLNNHHMCRCRAREAFTLSQPPVAIPPIRPVAPFLWIPSDPATQRSIVTASTMVNVNWALCAALLGQAAATVAPGFPVPGVPDLNVTWDDTNVDQPGELLPRPGEYRVTLLAAASFPLC